MKRIFILTLIILCFATEIISSQTVLQNKKGEFITSPEKGISLSEIEEVVLTPTVTGTAYGATSKVVVYLLLKDGTIYSRPSASPHDLDIVTSRKNQSSKWGTWSKSGDGLKVNFKSDQLWKTYYTTSRCSANEKIQGVFQTVGGFSDSKEHRFNTIVLSKNGSFVWRYFYRSKGSYKPHATDKKIEGTYKIKDYTIELTYNSGSIERFLIAKHKKGSGLVIGSKSFYPFDHPLLR